MGAEDSQWKETIISTLQGCSDEKGKKGRSDVKKLRKSVLLTMQIDASDKDSKKKFKKIIQGLEQDGKLSLDAEGLVKLKKVKKEKKDKKGKKDKNESKKRKSMGEHSTGSEEDVSKKAKSSAGDQGDITTETQETSTYVDEQYDTAPSIVNSEKSVAKPCKGNPQGVTRLFLGNLPFAVDETSLNEFLNGSVTHIKWITDQATGRFYGSAFVEVDTAENGAAAVAKAGSKLLGRPMKINFAPARPGDVWPPVKKVVSGGGQAGGSGVKAMSEKPENCCKLFIGNLSYDIDDEAIAKFFANVDAEIKAVRWLHHKDSGDFKGVGFVEFWNTEACERGATLNGKNLLGRPIRIDWTD